MDGQWSKIPLRDIDGNPFTRLQFQKIVGQKLASKTKLCYLKA